MNSIADRPWQGPSSSLLPIANSLYSKKYVKYLNLKEPNPVEEHRFLFYNSLLHIQKKNMFIQVLIQTIET